MKKTGTETKTNVIEINFDISTWKIKPRVSCKTPCATDTLNSDPQNTENSDLQITHIKKDNKEIYKEKYKQNNKENKNRAHYKNHPGYKNKPSVFSPEGRSYDLDAYENSSIFD